MAKATQKKRGATNVDLLFFRDTSLKGKITKQSWEGNESERAPETGEK